MSTRFLNNNNFVHILPIEGRPYGKEEEEDADKEIEDIPEIRSFPSETLAWVPTPVPFIVVAEVAAGFQQFYKILISRLPSIFLNDQPVEREKKEKRKTKILSHLR